MSMIMNKAFFFPDDYGFDYGPLYTVEFDVHGDRQCTRERGGTDCLARAYPKGFGMQLVKPIEALGEVIDARMETSSFLRFQVEYAYRWTAQPQRFVGRATTAAGTGFFNVAVEAQEYPEGWTELLKSFKSEVEPHVDS